MVSDPCPLLGRGPCLGIRNVVCDHVDLLTSAKIRMKFCITHRSNEVRHRMSGDNISLNFKRPSAPLLGALGRYACKSRR